MLLDTVKNISISDFNYPLPDERIPRHPLSERASCRLLYLPAGASTPKDLRFSDLPELIPTDSVLVCNDTRVINARMRFRKESGAEIEVFLLEPLDPRDYVLAFQAWGECRWSCMVGNLKRWKDYPLLKELSIGGRQVILTARRLSPLEGNAHEIEFSWDDPEVTFASVVEAAGFIPIPPYLKRESEESDSDDYQTVYARVQGSVAAPTAGLHFTPEVLEAIAERGVKRYPVTLHVGAGTFQPVKSAEIGGHPMHTEVFSVSRPTVAALRDALAENRQITAVGTTTVRTLESLPYLGRGIAEGRRDLHVDQWDPYRTETPFSREETISALNSILDYMDSEETPELTASTSIMIAPGFTWQIVKGIITNFHQPESTLLLLVSSFLGQNADGTPRWKDVYDHALRSDYRFLSYGDACYFSR